ncbi:GntR family transcriptional regulator [uncultured Enterovirga sp.]|uniref:GntR family transcriptional regulator n=1 Tax=uncultured Enterovirga sp. TaxID=2026352 RepID=UPI0035CB1D03
MAGVLTGPTPLYFQVQEQVRKRIASGEFGPGALLPTETQLCDQFGVSRITVKKALDGLMADRLIRRRRGVGTFVADHPEPAKSVHLTGWIDEMLDPVREPSYRLLGAGIEPTPMDVRDALPAGNQAFCLEWLYLSDGTVFSFSKIYMAPELGLAIRDELAEHEQPSIRIIERLLGARLERAEQTLVPVLPSRQVASHLGVPEGRPVLEVLRTYFVTGNGPVSVLKAWYHPDRVRYAIELFPRPPETDT